MRSLASSPSLTAAVDLITRGTPRPDGKILIIGGGIANFTNVAATFKGIIRALKQYQKPLQAHKVRIFVRRGGPNYQEGLKAMRLLGETLGVEIQVFGPDAHITAVVPLALGVTKADPSIASSLGVSETAGVKESYTPAITPRSTSPVAGRPAPANGVSTSAGPSQPVEFEAAASGARPWYRPYDENTRAIVYGLQPRAIQGMLDFDFSCGRKTPSVAAMIYAFGGHYVQKFCALRIRLSGG